MVSVFHLHPATYPTDAYALMLVCAVATFPNARRLPDFRNPMVSAPQIRSALHGCWYEHRAFVWPRRSDRLSTQFPMDRKLLPPRLRFFFFWDKRRFLVTIRVTLCSCEKDRRLVGEVRTSSHTWM